MNNNSATAASDHPYKVAGQQLKRILKVLHRTPRELSKVLDISEADVKNLLSGKTGATVDQLTAMSEEFRIDLVDVVHLSDLPRNSMVFIFS